MTNSTRLAALLLALAACGGGKAKGGVGNTGTGPEPVAAALPPGTSGFPGLDWGDSADAIKADYPIAEVGADEIVLRVPHGGRDAEVSLQLTGGGQLIAIGVEYGAFASMPACGEVFAQVRAELDQTLGESSEDNLAAYWSSDGYAATLSCNPDEGEQALLSLSYALPEGDV